MKQDHDFAVPTADLLIGELPSWEAGVCSIIGLTDGSIARADFSMRELQERANISLHNPPNYIAVYGENDHLVELIPINEFGSSARKVNREVVEAIRAEHEEL